MKKLSDEELVRRVAQLLLRKMWVGAEMGKGNSSLRDITCEEYFEVNKREWCNQAIALIDFIKNSSSEFDKGRKAIELVGKTVTVLQDVKDTIEYCKLYVENRALSAEDDCDISLKLINDLLKDYEEATNNLERSE